MSDDEVRSRSTVLLARLGPLLFVLTLFIQVAAIVLALTTQEGAQPFAVQPLLTALATSAVALAFGLVGAILTSRLPRNRIGWLLNIAGFCLALNGLAWWYLTKAHATVPPAFPATGEVGTIGQLIGTPVALLFIAVALVTFPDGKFLTPRWRALPMAGVGAVVAFALGAGLGSAYVPYFPGVPNPYFLSGIPNAVFTVLRLLSVAIGLVLVIGAAVSLVRRYRRADLQQRQQLRWIAYAAVITAAASVPMIIAFNTAGPAELGPRTSFTTVFWFVFCLGATSIPIAFLVAITRYRLYAIDRIINGTIVYFGLVAILAGLYAAVNEILKRLFVALTGEESDVAFVITTLILASTLTPVRQWLERRAESRFKTPKKLAAGVGEASLDAETMEAVASRAADLAVERVMSALRNQ